MYRRYKYEFLTSNPTRANQFLLHLVNDSCYFCDFEVWRLAQSRRDGELCTAYALVSPERY